MLKICITYIVLFFIFIIKFTYQDKVGDHGSFIKVISNFFIQRHVQTITAATCWPTGNYNYYIDYDSNLSETILY